MRHRAVEPSWPFDGRRGRLLWSYYRLSVMPPAELPHRVIEHFRRNVDRRGGIPRTVGEWAVPDSPPPAWPIDPRCFEHLDLAELHADTDAVLTGEMELLGVKRPPGSRTDWALDPTTQTQWPVDTFTFDIQIRNMPPGKEMKVAQELNRWQHLQILALAANRLGREDAREAVFADLESWIDANPPFRGFNYVAGIEVASRIASLLVILGLAGPAPDRLHAKLWRTFRAHGLWTARYPSLYSSANNHLMAELAALHALASLAPELPESSQWLHETSSGLEREAARQILADGVTAEQSPTYQAYTMEWLLLARQAAHHDGRALPQVDQRLQAGAAFLTSIMDSQGNFPHIGDHDGGVVMRFALGELPHVRSVCGVVAGITARPELFPVGWVPDARSSVFGAPRLEVQEAARRSRTFREGGYTALHNQRSMLVFDHGPLGFNTGGHGHADALAVWLHLDGEPILIDTGTFKYNGADAARRYIRSTAAHNTLTVDEQDQSQMTGAFNWGRRANVTFLSAQLTGEGGFVDAEHDGYRRLGVRHRRSVLLENGGLVIADDLQGSDRHRICAAFHFAPDLELALRPNEVIVKRAGGRILSLRPPEEARVSVHRQSDRPDAGWYSPRYNRAESRCTLLLEARLQLPAAWTTQLSFAPVEA